MVTCNYVNFRRDSLDENDEKSRPNSNANTSSSGSSMAASRQIYNNKQLNRSPLAIDRYRKHILDILGALRKTVIFIGETASGKSTQIPQLCYEAGMSNDGRIAVTQPRRVAARILAQRVAQEMGTEVGQLVGYKFRFENITDKKETTHIVYQTEGILLREALHDTHLSQYSTVIVDEVHERSVNMDVLLYVLRQAQKERKSSNNPLRIILMSATMDATALAHYFYEAPIYYVRGRMHSVKLLYADHLRVDENDYLFNAIAAVLQLHQIEPLENGFLVFLTGQEEIDMAIKVMRKEKRADLKMSNIYPMPLYSAANTQIQQRAFELVDEGQRKVVFATNIAETSVTIPGIRIVIDSGKVKRRSYTALERMDILRVENISKAQAIQRAGRAGRDGPGKCYRLYSQKDYDKFEGIQRPELLRTNLSSTLLMLVGLGLCRVKRLGKLLDPPEPMQLQSAIDELIALRAVYLEESNEEMRLSITDSGRQMLEFPLEPAHAKILLAASELGCLEEACIVVAFLCSEPVFQWSSQDLFCHVEDNKFGQEKGATILDNNCSISGGGAGFSSKMYTAEGDHVRYLKIWQRYSSLKSLKAREETNDFCVASNLNGYRLENVGQAHKQLLNLCRTQKLRFSGPPSQLSQQQESHLQLRRAICEGLFQNACIWDQSKRCYVMDRNRRQIQVRIHPSSCLAAQQPRAFVFTELVQTNEVYARDICPVQMDWIYQQQQPYATESGSKNVMAPEHQRIRQMAFLTTALVRASPTCSSTASSTTSTSSATKRSSKRRRRNGAMVEQPARSIENEGRKQEKVEGANECDETNEKRPLEQQPREGVMKEQQNPLAQKQEDPAASSEKGEEMEETEAAVSEKRQQRQHDNENKREKRAQIIRRGVEEEEAKETTRMRRKRKKECAGRTNSNGKKKTTVAAEGMRPRLVAYSESSSTSESDDDDDEKERRDSNFF